MEENDKVEMIEKASYTSVNFTDLGAHVGVAENAEFERVEPWRDRNERNVDDNRMMDPEVDFDLSFSCDTNPECLFNRIKREWKRQGGAGLS